MIDKNAINIFLSFLFVFIFIIGMVNFVILFPQEQGFTFEEKDNIIWVSLDKSISESVTTVNLDINKTVTDADEGFDQWDIEIGFMGSNTQKSIKNSLTGYTKGVVNMIGVILDQLFNVNNARDHPVFIVLSIVLVAITFTIIYVVIKIVKTGS